MKSGEGYTYFPPRTFSSSFPDQTKAPECPIIIFSLGKGKQAFSIPNFGEWKEAHFLDVDPKDSLAAPAN